MIDGATRCPLTYLDDPRCNLMSTWHISMIHNSTQCPHGISRRSTVQLDIPAESLADPRCDSMSLVHLLTIYSAAQHPPQHLSMVHDGLDVLQHPLMIRDGTWHPHDISQWSMVGLDVPTTSLDAPWWDSTSLLHLSMVHGVTRHPYDISRSPTVQLYILVTSLVIPQCNTMYMRCLSMIHGVTQCPWHLSIFHGVTWCPCDISHYPAMQLDIPVAWINLLWCDSRSSWHLSLSHNAIWGPYGISQPYPWCDMTLYSVTQHPHDISHSPMVPTPSDTTPNNVNVD